MKKTIVLFLISLFMLQSCSINSEIIYHKDAASTSVTDIDTREFMAEMKAMTPDSLKEKEFGDMDKLPTAWTSIYDLEKQEGKLKTTNPDSIRIMKKIFMKSKKENNEPAGFSFKMEHFVSEDYKALENFTKHEKLPLDQNIFNNWDGKTLTINTDNFNLKNIEETLRTKSLKEETEKIEGMMTMFFKNIGTTLKFENKIKSISGKHDWLKQVDDHSLRIEYDLKAMYDQDAKFKNADKKIVIVTE
ncbi:hypothetical protein C1637_00560 [Chryseobacterium lactis]|uniref:Lipoprotein n=1 Tax=Chryseobacterium lactis TaxID=1241981 RepID=A0A3G6RP75_CHRLC|nr:hypothetical protein [Chryseobacterium lactis]AZA81107.1 hypothetical protein EG342_03945 [Chryseobacterium lactis]AZB06108.1 hypothetical protein EG341_20070 [Chryseobacterium lactis]PNW14958.1 hypothetical protein C1637_00560 [Chryseobacterium lactis]